MSGVLAELRDRRAIAELRDGGTNDRVAETLERSRCK